MGEVAPDFAVRVRLAAHVDKIGIDYRQVNHILRFCSRRETYFHNRTIAHFLPGDCEFTGTGRERGM
jgi:hypothetical protein